MSQGGHQINDIFDIVSDGKSMTCLAWPRAPIALVAMTVIVALAGILPAWWIVRGLLDRHDQFENVASGIAVGIPIGLALPVLLVMVRRAKLKRGVEIVDGTVTLFTPDSTRSRHQFDLNQLKGATLTGTGGTATLRIELRRGGSIPVFIGFPSTALGRAMDAINSMVIDNRYHGFEVIAKVHTEPTTLPSPVLPVDRL